MHTVSKVIGLFECKRVMQEKKITGCIYLLLQCFVTESQQQTEIVPDCRLEGSFCRLPSFFSPRSANFMPSGNKI